MDFRKTKWVKVLLFTLLLFVALFFLRWRFISYISLGWNKYSNKTTRYQYSFSYPKDWAVSECGNGEVVVAKKPITRCYRPLDAPEEYLDNVYFQVFLPENHYGIYDEIEKMSIPERLKDWSTLFFYWDEEKALFNKIIRLNLINEHVKMRSNFFPVPVKPEDTDVYVKYSEQNRRNKYVTKTEKRILAYPLHHFTVGFYPYLEYQKELQFVRDSFHYFYK